MVMLRKIGIAIGFDREGRVRTRTIRITATKTQTEPENAGSRSSKPSASSVSMLNSNRVNGFAAPDPRTVGGVDGTGRGPVSTVRPNPLQSNAMTVADDADADRPSQSGPEKR